MSQKHNLASHFYIEPDRIKETGCIFSRDESNHILKIFRLYVGDMLRAADGQGNLYDVQIKGYEGKSVVGEIVKTSRWVNELPIDITLAFGLTQQGKTDQIVDQCTQLGVRAFVPILSKHSLPKLNEEKATTRVDRWRKVAVGSMKQSLRSFLPDVYLPMAIDEITQRFGTFDKVFLASLKGEAPPPKKDGFAAKRFLLITGPEQGFSRIEEDQLIKAGAAPISLGERRLRAELAPVVLVAQFLSLV